MEIWKEIEGTDGRYSVSSLGRVKSNGYTVRIGRNTRFAPVTILKERRHNQGYSLVTVSNGKNNSLVHRLVAKAFLPNPDNKEFVNHKNGIKTDNRVENLEWMTRQENEDHAFSTGLKKRITSSKLTEDNVIFILENHTKIRRTELSKMFNVSMNTINRVVNRVIWRHIKVESKPIEYLNSVTILNAETGIFYENIKEASDSINKKVDYLGHRLRGFYKNKTPFIYV